jgi:hypothetical protein
MRNIELQILLDFFQNSLKVHQGHLGLYEIFKLQI